MQILDRKSRRYMYRWVSVMLKKFLDAYIECALFCGLDEDMRGEEYLLSLEFKSRARKDCAEFYRANKMLWNDDVRAGQNFWYNRNGYGLDDDDFKNSEQLSAIAESLGQVDLYIADDGLIYFM